MVAESESARAIESWTIWLVIILLLVFYRAPVIALVPLITLYVAVQVALRILALLAQAGYLELFHGLEVYTSVVVYAAGVDYNLFLISRYEEEVEGESGIGQALARALGQDRRRPGSERRHGDLRHRHTDVRRVRQVPRGRDRHRL